MFKEIENGFRDVIAKFADARRTKILNIENEDDEPMPKQKRERKVDEENTKPKGKIVF